MQRYRLWKLIGLCMALTLIWAFPIRDTQAAPAGQPLNDFLAGLFAPVGSASATTFVSPLPTTFLSPVTLVPYQGSGYHYKVVNPGAEAGFEQPGYAETGFLTGPAAFGSVSDFCPINSATNIRTLWSLSSDLLLRRSINIPPGVVNVRVGAAVDNEIQVFLNGQDVSGGLQHSEFCAVPDTFVFQVPNTYLQPGDNLLAARVRDLGVLNYGDLQITADRPTSLLAKAGYDSIKLTWSPAPSPYVAQYRILRAPQGSTAFIPVTFTQDTTYFDPAGNGAARGNIYCYYVEALAATGEVLFNSETACARMGEILLWVQDARSPSGGTLTVNVNLRNADNLRASGIAIWLDYDNRVLELLDVISTPLTDGYVWRWQATPGGNLTHVRISAAAIEGLPTLYDDGALFQLRFRAIGMMDSNSALDLREFISGLGGSAIYPYPGATSAPLVLQDGVFRTDGSLMLGDLNGDGVIDMQDVYLALDFANWVGSPTADQLQAGDINGNGVIDAGDAAMILYYIQHGGWPSVPASMALARLFNSGPSRLILDDFSGRPGQLTHTLVRAENLRDAAGATLAIAYDPVAIAEITHVRAVGLASDRILQYHVLQPGLLLITFAGPSSLSGSGALLEIAARLNQTAQPGASYPVTLADVTLTDLAGRDLEYSTLHCTVEREPGVLSVYHTLFIPMVTRSN